MNVEEGGPILYRSPELTHSRPQDDDSPWLRPNNTSINLESLFLTIDLYLACVCVPNNCTLVKKGLVRFIGLVI